MYQRCSGYVVVRIGDCWTVEPDDFVGGLGLARLLTINRECWADCRCPKAFINMTPLNAICKRYRTYSVALFNFGIVLSMLTFPPLIRLGVCSYIARFHLEAADLPHTIWLSRGLISSEIASRPVEPTRHAWKHSSPPVKPAVISSPQLMRERFCLQKDIKSHSNQQTRRRLILSTLMGCRIVRQILPSDVVPMGRTR